jgi:hypothetical protein
MKATMKFFNHEGVEYVTFFPADGDPVTKTVDEAMTYCTVIGNAKGITLIDAEHVFGECVSKMKLFSWSTPNPAQAILEERGAAKMLQAIKYDLRNIAQIEKISQQ